MALNFGNLPQSGSILANYDYGDLAEGLGYQIYYGCSSTSGANLVTTTNTIVSELPHTAVISAAVSTTIAKYIDEKTFDLTFNMPKNIKGTIVINCPIGLKNTGAEADYEFHVVASAYHVDTTPTEILIGTANSRTFFGADVAANNWASGTACIKIESANVTHFKKGETLRFKISAWFKVNTADRQATLGIAHEPSGAADYDYSLSGNVADDNEKIINSGSTVLEFHVPYVLDI